MACQELNNICQRSGWPRPDIKYFSEGSGKAKEVVLKNGQKLTVETVSHYGYGVLGNQLVTQSGG